MHALATGDDFYRQVAHMQWGNKFWEEAALEHRQRATRGMRHELYSIQRLRDRLNSTGNDMWTIVDFKAFWKYDSR